MESSETAALLTEAMACLQDRPVLFKYEPDTRCAQVGRVLFGVPNVLLLCHTDMS